MDLITDSIRKNRHIHTWQYLHKQTWETFYEVACDKKIYLYGAGGGCNYLIKSKPELHIEAVIDSNIRKQKLVVGEILDEAICTPFQNMQVYPVEHLKTVSPDRAVILITSVKEYVSISKELAEMGFENLFVVLLLEFSNTDRKQELSESSSDTYLKRCSNVAGKVVREKQISKNKVVFSIGAYGGHARAITAELLKQNIKFDIVWLVNEKKIEHPQGIRLVMQNSWLETYELETASIWVYDVMVPQYCIKREGQTYIQTKHWSSLTLKRFYLEDGDTCKSDSTQQEIHQNAKWMDIVFSGSTIDEETCRSGFGVGNIFKRIGSPRSDILFRSGIKEKVYRQYGIPAAKKCIVYAPTFRSAELFQGKKVVMELDITRLLMECEQKFGSEWVLLLRLHPIIAEKNKDISLGDNVISVSDYPNSQELMAAADILITDYSSLMFEPAYVGKKVFLYAPDRDAYIEKERTLIFDYDSLPFSVAETNDELINCIHTFDEEKYQERLLAFMGKYEVREDGHASERAADIIMELLEGK